MKKVTLVSLLISIFSFSFSDNKGFYVGLSGGIASSETYALDDGSFGGKANPGGSALLGYQFNQYFSTELTYLYLGNSETLGINQSQTFLSTSFKGILPLDEQFSLFAKAGIGYNFASATGKISIGPNSNSDIAFNSNNLFSVLGIGLGYNFTEFLQLSIADDYYLVSAPKLNDKFSSSTKFGYGNTNFFSLGINYKF